jgi:asparagine synthase (glutamine-hydrolysing)
LCDGDRAFHDGAFGNLAVRYAPFCPGGGRDGAAGPFDPGGEPYGEATAAMLEQMREAGAHTVVCGVGGDELMALRPDERNSRADDRQFPAWLSPTAVDLLLATQDVVAPASVINEVTLMAMACGAPRYLRAGMWTLAPLAHPDLVRFSEWLPAQWRRGKRLLRYYLARLGLPDLVVNPPIRENLAPVMQVGLRGHGLPWLRRLSWSRTRPSRLDLTIVRAR